MLAKGHYNTVLDNETIEMLYQTVRSEGEFSMAKAVIPRELHEFYTLPDGVIYVFVMNIDTKMIKRFYTSDSNGRFVNYYNRDYTGE
jgi:hypothetical protein